MKLEMNNTSPFTLIFNIDYNISNTDKVSKDAVLIPVTGGEGPWGCETLRLPHFLDSRLTDGALRAGSPLPPRKIHGTRFCQRLSRPQDHSAAGRIKYIEKCQ
jgi:hypothetical protein